MSKYLNIWAFQRSIIFFKKALNASCKIDTCTDSPWPMTTVGTEISLSEDLTEMAHDHNLALPVAVVKQLHRLFNRSTFPAPLCQEGQDPLPALLHPGGSAYLPVPTGPRPSPCSTMHRSTYLCLFLQAGLILTFQIIMKMIAFVSFPDQKASKHDHSEG